MNEEKKWIAQCGRLDMQTFIYWVALANGVLVVSIALGALVAFLAMKFGAPFALVQTATLLVFALCLALGGRSLKKLFDTSRGDLEIIIEDDLVVFKKWGKSFSQFSIVEQAIKIEGKGEEMGLSFQSTGVKAVKVGCLHPSMEWKEAVQDAYNFELEPSEFVRLVGELGMEEKVQRRG